MQINTVLGAIWIALIVVPLIGLRWLSWRVGYLAAMREVFRQIDIHQVPKSQALMESLSKAMDRLDRKGKP